VRSARPDQTMFTPVEVAALYRVTEATVLTWIRTGDLKAVNVGRTRAAKKPRWRITAAALAEFEAARTPTPATPRVRRKQRGDVIEFYQ
jgi:hypothetical protein